MWLHDLGQKLVLMGALRAAKKYRQELEKKLSPFELEEIQLIAKKISETDKTFIELSSGGLVRLRGNPEMLDLLELQAIAYNPFILPYRRPALRFSPPGYRDLLSSTPVVTVPSFHFHASTARFSCSGKPYVKVPFGLIFAIGSIGRAAFAVLSELSTNNVEMLTKSPTLKPSLLALFYIAENITSPTPVLAQVISQVMGPVTLMSAAKPAHVAHVIGTFILLHEYGHISLGHQPLGKMPTEADIARNCLQELEADSFALTAILRLSDGNEVEWNEVRELHTHFVCMLLLILELHTRLKSVKLKPGYPPFSERCTALLDRFSAPPKLRQAVDHFAYTLGTVEIAD